jgi:putative transposase
MDKHSTIKNSKRKRRYINIIKERMKNQVNDSHWKIINYLTNTYKTILIGKWSTKSIISNKKSILCNMDKRVIQKLSFYQFIEKLKYKCLIKSVDLKLVDEHYTSKVCTNCSNFYKDLKGEEIYNCTKCNIKIKRDYNGSRNIFLKSIKLQDI